VLDSAWLVNVVANVASMRAPENARPKESPKDPAAELTLVASLARSSVTGESV
jgi:hypothetical protein